ncbi:MAG: hypothetical protein ACREJQ_01055 [bacterium]
MASESTSYFQNILGGMPGFSAMTVYKGKEEAVALQVQSDPTLPPGILKIANRSFESMTRFVDGAVPGEILDEFFWADDSRYYIFSRLLEDAFHVLFIFRKGGNDLATIRMLIRHFLPALESHLRPAS